MTAPIGITSGDSLRITVPVTDQATGAALNLTSATCEAAAEYGATQVEATVTVTDAAGGIMRLDFAPGDLTDGIWTVQARVTIGAETQTVAARQVRVAESVFD